MKDEWLENLLKNPENRSKLSLFMTIIQIVLGAWILIGILLSLVIFLKNTL
jgi:hypothetical protein